MSLFEDFNRFETRRQFFGRGKNALAYAALGSLLGGSMKLWGDDTAGKLALPHFPPKVKNIIYLHMARPVTNCIRVMSGQGRRAWARG